MRLEFKLKKKSNARWKLKTLIVGVIGICLIGLYLSPVGQMSVSFCKKTWNILMEKAHWQLNQVIVEGHKRTDKKNIMDALDLVQGQDMDTISLIQIRQRLLDLPWVKEVMVERHLPDTLVIRIMEKTPIALWQNNQSYLPLDEFGHPIQDNKLLPTDLILVVGSDAPENTLPLLKALEQVPNISSLVRSASRVEKRRWNLYLMDPESGLEIMLPEVDFDQALKRLEFQNTKENLFKKNIKAIDIRLSDRIILHPLKNGVQKKDKKK